MIDVITYKLVRTIDRKGVVVSQGVGSTVLRLAQDRVISVNANTGEIKFPIPAVPLVYTPMEDGTCVSDIEDHNRILMMPIMEFNISAFLRTHTVFQIQNTAYLLIVTKNLFKYPLLDEESFIEVEIVDGVFDGNACVVSRTEVAQRAALAQGENISRAYFESWEGFISAYRLQKADVEKETTKERPVSSYVRDWEPDPLQDGDLNCHPE